MAWDNINPITVKTIANTLYLFIMLITPYTVCSYYRAKPAKLI